MALQSFPVKRVQDPPPPASISEITPINWHRYPGKVITKAMTDRQFLGPVGYTGGLPNQGAAADNNGETGTANVTNDWNPKTQAAKATAMGTTIAPDIGRPRGAIDPRQPYPTAATPAPVAPTITSLTPNTAVHGGPDQMVKIVGTGFTNWTQLYVGGQTIPTRYAKYVSPTEMQVLMDIARSVAGTATIIAKDAGLSSAPATFTFT